ncbi:unnamed protein product [Amoebophrya sp. A25]|nr:unnamed protein product [Amoebophrya sp. A25]|eukprot:GSA25T00026258001.1
MSIGERVDIFGCCVPGTGGGAAAETGRGDISTATQQDEQQDEAAAKQQDEQVAANAISHYMLAVLQYRPFCVWARILESEEPGPKKRSAIVFALQTDYRISTGVYGPGNEAERDLRLAEIDRLVQEMEFSRTSSSGSGSKTRGGERARCYLKAMRAWMLRDLREACNFFLDAVKLFSAEKGEIDLFACKRAQLMGLFLGEPKLILEASTAVEAFFVQEEGLQEATEDVHPGHASRYRPWKKAVPAQMSYWYAMHAFALEQTSGWEAAEALVELGKQVKQSMTGVYYGLRSLLATDVDHKGVVVEEAPPAPAVEGAAENHQLADPHSSANTGDRGGDRVFDPWLLHSELHMLHRTKSWKGITEAIETYMETEVENTIHRGDRDGSIRLILGQKMHVFLYTHLWWHAGVAYAEEGELEETEWILRSRCWDCFKKIAIPVMPCTGNNLSKISSAEVSGVADSTGVQKGNLLQDPGVQLNALGLLWRLLENKGKPKPSSSSRAARTESTESREAHDNSTAVSTTKGEGEKKKGGEKNEAKGEKNLKSINEGEDQDIWYTFVKSSGNSDKIVVDPAKALDRFRSEIMGVFTPHLDPLLDVLYLRVLPDAGARTAFARGIRTFAEKSGREQLKNAAAIAETVVEILDQSDAEDAKDRLQKADLSCLGNSWEQRAVLELLWNSE